jgi:defect-in-organelle-trafficking protein DotD
MNNSSILAPIFLCCALGGCAAPRAVKMDNVPDEVDKHILEASRKIELMQLQLVQAGALRQTPKTIPVGVVSKDQTITLSWRGDAYPLLAKLASDRGLAFDSVGVRLPLPIAIKVQDQPFEAVLDAIRAQTGYRAVVLQSAIKITLQFNRPQEERS